MPYSIGIRLHTVHTLPATGGERHRALNALFYHWLDAAEPRLAQFVHDQAEPKPFTLSPLVSDGEGRYHFRATLLEDEYGPYVADGVTREKTVRVGDEILEIQGAPQIEHRTYAELVQPSVVQSDIALHFETPTSFRVNDLDDPLPYPRRVFQSYLTKWNAFSEAPFHPVETFLEWVEQSVAVARLDLQTEVMRFDVHMQIGSVGQVQYRLAKRTSSDGELLRWLNVLAEYARFCGTGRKTTQGMGQTRRLPHWEEREKAH